MTSTATLERHSPPRLVRVARMHSVGWLVGVAAPAGVLALAFTIAWTIFALVPNPDSTTQFTGAVVSVFFFGLAFYAQAMTQTFPFALGLSVTRREFYFATGLTAFVQAVVFGTAIYVLSLVESATDGWGVHMRMFGLADYATDSPLVRWLTPIAAFVLVYGIGLLCGTVYLRWRVYGLVALSTSTVAAVGATAIVLTWGQWWGDVTDVVTDTPRVVLLVLVPLVLSTVSTTIGWAVLRKAVS
ncbi:ABC transporter permease [Actinomycetes bacterium M1A6_2h]